MRRQQDRTESASSTNRLGGFESVVGGPGETLDTVEEAGQTSTDDEQILDEVQESDQTGMDAEGEAVINEELEVLRTVLIFIFPRQVLRRYVRVA